MIEGFISEYDKLYVFCIVEIKLQLSNEYLLELIKSSLSLKKEIIQSKSQSLIKPHFGILLSRVVTPSNRCVPLCSFDSAKKKYCVISLPNTN